MPDTISLESLRAKLAAGEIRGVAEPTLGGYFLRMYGPEGSGEPTTTNTNAAAAAHVRPRGQR